MSENSSSDLGAFLAGFVIGGLVGAATALILAPQSGHDTRSQITTKSHDLRLAGGERVHQYRDQASQVMHDARDRATTTGTSLQDQARIVLDKGKERLSSDATSNDTPDEEPVTENPDPVEAVEPEDTDEEV